MISSADVKFLQTVTRRMSEERLHAYLPGRHRSSAALILRFGDEHQKHVVRAVAALRASSSSSSSGYRRPTVIPGLRHDTSMYSSTKMVNPTAEDEDLGPLWGLLQDMSSATELGSLKLLFVRRADRETSRWSGGVAFPGGQRDPEDGDDADTVCREVEEQLGLPLRPRDGGSSSAGDFVYLGRLRDGQLRSRTLGLLTAGGIIQSRFVFLHVGDLTPSVGVAHHQIAGLQWMPLDYMASNNLDRFSVQHPLSAFLHPTDADARLLLGELFPRAVLHFPSLRLTDPVSGSTSVRWAVWGLPLHTASELLVLGDRMPLAWPLCSSNSLLLEWVGVNAVHGYAELFLNWYRLRGWLRYHFSRSRPSLSAGSFHAHYTSSSWYERRRALLPQCSSPLLLSIPEDGLSVRRQCCFLMDVVLLIAMLYGVATLLFTTGSACRLALGIGEEARSSEARRLEYFLSNTPLSVERAGDVDGEDHVSEGSAPEGDLHNEAMGGSGPHVHAEAAVVPPAWLEGRQVEEVRAATDTRDEAETHALPVLVEEPAPAKVGDAHRGIDRVLRATVGVWTHRPEAASVRQIPSSSPPTEAERSLWGELLLDSGPAAEASTVDEVLHRYQR